MCSCDCDRSWWQMPLGCQLPLLNVMKKWQRGRVKLFMEASLYLATCREARQSEGCF